MSISIIPGRHTGGQAVSSTAWAAHQWILSTRIFANPEPFDCEKFVSELGDEPGYIYATTPPVSLPGGEQGQPGGFLYAVVYNKDKDKYLIFLVSFTLDSTWRRRGYPVDATLSLVDYENLKTYGPLNTPKEVCEWFTSKIDRTNRIYNVPRQYVHTEILQSRRYWKKILGPGEFGFINSWESEEDTTDDDDDELYGGTGDTLSAEELAAILNAILTNSESDQAGYVPAEDANLDASLSAALAAVRNELSPNPESDDDDADFAANLAAAVAMSHNFMPNNHVWYTNRAGDQMSANIISVDADAGSCMIRVYGAEEVTERDVLQSSLRPMDTVIYSRNDPVWYTRRGSAHKATVVGATDSADDSYVIRIIHAHVLEGPEIPVPGTSLHPRGAVE